MDDYRVSLPDFHGPLDLLLHLVKRNEVDVRDIPIATIADQFLTYIELLRSVDVELAGDFLVVASTLMEIKSRLILPGGEEARPEKSDDPRQELVRQLIEYKRYKDAATSLEARAAERGRRRPRGESPMPHFASTPSVEPVELWDLVAAFGRLVQEAAVDEPREVVADETPQHVYRDEMLERVARSGRIPFRAAFAPPYHRVRLIGLFLALLELIKQGSIAFESTSDGDELWLYKTENAST